MLNYRVVRNNASLLQSLTGFKVEEFEQLLVPFESAWIAYLIKRQRIFRHRRYKAELTTHLATIEDKLLFILVYFWLYPNQCVLGLLFGIKPPQARVWVHKLTGVLYVSLGYEKQLLGCKPQRLEAILQQCPSLDSFINAKIQRIIFSKKAA